MIPDPLKQALNSIYYNNRSKREVMIPSTNPAPCQYTVEDSVLHPSPRSHKSVFNSKSHRGGLEKAKLVMLSSVTNITLQCCALLLFVGSPWSWVCNQHTITYTHTYICTYSLPQYIYVVYTRDRVPLTIHQSWMRLVIPQS